jgi:hypothetical protein
MTKSNAESPIETPMIHSTVELLFIEYGVSRVSKRFGVSAEILSQLLKKCRPSQAGALISSERSEWAGARPAQNRLGVAGKQDVLAIPPRIKGRNVSMSPKRHVAQRFVWPTVLSECYAESPSHPAVRSGKT